MITIHMIPGSPFGRAVLIAALEKQAPHRVQPLAPGEHKQPAYLARQPFGRMPAIEDDGFALYETQAILDYIDATYGTPGSLTPRDAKAKARMRQVMGVIDWYFFARDGAIPLVFNRYVAPRLGLPVDEAAVAAAIPATRHVVGVLEGFVKNSPHMAGDAFTLADIHAGAQLDILAETPEGAEIIAGTALEPWLKRLNARPSFPATTYDRVTELAAAA
jgi:glutathione S-transferase